MSDPTKIKTQKYFITGINRYCFDTGMCSSKNNFAQIDTEQDASYFGIWANPFKLVIVTYAEGDLLIGKANDEKDFLDELQFIKKFHENQGYKFYGIDPGFNDQLKTRFIELGLENLLY